MSEKMKLYYGSISPRCRRVLAVGYHLSYEFDLRPLMSFEAFEAPEFLAKNPNGLVPVLEDGTFDLWESNAIMQYLADKKGETALYPKDIQVRADIARWQSWTIAHFDPAAGVLLWENAFKKFLGAGEAPDLAEVERGELEFKQVASVLDHHLAERKFLVGDHLTLADYSVAAFLMYTEEAQYPMAGFPHIAKWYAEVATTDAWKKSGQVITGLSKK